jgi:RNA polymerase sigma-70 factor (ECF subfamily)
MEFVDAYLAALDPVVSARMGRDAVAADLAEAAQAARAAVPSLDLAAFARELATRAESGVPPPAAHAGDLAIAYASLRGDRAALRALDPVLLASVASAVARIDRSPAFADAVAQELRTALLVGPSPRLAQYAGRGPLGGWLRTAAARVALNMRRNKDDEAKEDVTSGLRALGREPEVELLRGRYEKEIGEALRGAVERLPLRERAMLLLSVRDGVTVEQLASLYHLSKSTAQRCLASARELLAAETRKALRERLGLSEAELDSVAGAIVSGMHVSIARALATSRLDLPRRADG